MREPARRILLLPGDRGLFAELGDAVGEPGNFAAGGIAMDNALLRGANECRFCSGHGGSGGGAITG